MLRPKRDKSTIELNEHNTPLSIPIYPSRLLRPDRDRRKMDRMVRNNLPLPIPIDPSHLILLYGGRSITDPNLRDTSVSRANQPDPQNQSQQSRSH